MAAKSTTFRNDLLLLIFNNTDIALIGDAAGLQNSAAAGNLYVSLHTGDPISGNQSTSEIAYTNYARIAVVRSSSGWTVSAGACTNAAAITFALYGGGAGGTVTFAGVGTDASGTGKLLYSSACTSLLVTTGVTPEIPAGDLDITEV